MKRTAMALVAVMLIGDPIYAAETSSTVTDNQGAVPRNPQPTFFQSAYEPRSMLAPAADSQAGSTTATPEVPQFNASSVAASAFVPEANGSRQDYLWTDTAFSPTTYFSADAMILTRNNGTNRQPIVLDVAGGTTVLRASDLHFDYFSGPSFLLGRQWSPRTATEVSYFGLVDFTSTNVAAQPGNLAIPGDLGLASLNYFAADQMNLSYGSRLNNVEANVLFGSQRLSLLGGFRFLNLSESFNINSVNALTGTSDYQVATRNSMFGAQGGGRVKGQIGRYVDWSVTGKAGLFGDSIRAQNFAGDLNNNLILRNVTAHGSNAAFLGDLNWTAALRLTDHLSIRGGYNLIWIQNIALAPDQLDFSFTALSGSSINHTGGLLISGANVGLEAHW